MYKNYGKGRCSSHAIGWKTLNQLVLDDIRRNAIVARKMTQGYMDGIKSRRVDIHYKFIGYLDLKEAMRNGVWCRDEETDKVTLVKPEDLFQ